jgi:hypothetical protein
VKPSESADPAVNPLAMRALVRARLEPRIDAVIGRVVGLAEGAKREKHFAHEGVVYETRVVDDHDATLRASEQVFKLLDVYPARSTPGGARGQVLVVILGADGRPSDQRAVVTSKRGALTASASAIAQMHDSAYNADYRPSAPRRTPTEKNGTMGATPQNRKRPAARGNPSERGTEIPESRDVKQARGR